jgi:hypothetical protein
MTNSTSADLRNRVSGLGRGERVAAAGSAGLLLGMFLNWVTVSCDGPLCGMAGMGGAGGSGFHGFGWLSFLALIAAAGLLMVRALPDGTVRLPELPASDGVVITALGAAEAAGCLLFWLQYHDHFVSGGGISVGVGLGWFVALLAGVATAVGGQLMRSEPAH